MMKVPATERPTSDSASPASRANGRSIIEFEDVSFAYEREPVLKDVTIRIAERDFVSIVGPNAGGKTTLLKLILGLLTPSRGTLRVFGVTPERARPRVGYMPQYAQLDPQFPVSVLDVVLMGRLGMGRIFGPYGAADRRVAQRVLAEVGLADMGRRPFSMLSGGQRQRVLIARALACEPDLLLLDEPTSNLDIGIQDDFYELLRHLSERLTVILVSHDVGFVSKLVRTVVCVNRTVSVHCATELGGDAIVALYGRDVHMVHHDHDCRHEGGHS
ncbi:MAG TPA: ABC transporter ATP-binding protein [Phycisphaerae bacterium]|nr:ABC transporter ATP-binding protein [Phycisphaerae bacterium]